jgi:hypothetical protein
MLTLLQTLGLHLASAEGHQRLANESLSKAMAVYQSIISVGQDHGVAESTTSAEETQPEVGPPTYGYNALDFANLTVTNAVLKVWRERPDLSNDEIAGIMKTTGKSNEISANSVATMKSRYGREKPTTKAMTRHSWTKDEDVVCLFCQRYGAERLGMSEMEISRLFGMSLASFLSRKSNFRFLMSGTGLEHTARMSEEVWAEFENKSMTEHREDALEALDRAKEAMSADNKTAK